MFNPDQERDERGRFAAMGGSAGGHDAQIATAQPTAVGADRDTYQQPSADTMAKDPEAFHQNIGLFSNSEQFPNFREDELKGTDREKAQAIIENMASNLEFLYHQASPEVIAEGKVWYPAAHDIAGELAKTNNLNEASVAAAIAALSPQKDWDQNIEMARRLTDIYGTKQDYRFDDKMAAMSPQVWDAGKPGKGGKALEGAKREEKEAGFKAIRDGIAGKTLGELKGQPLLQAAWIRTYDEAHNTRDYPTFRPDGSKGPIARNEPNAKYPEGKPTPMVWQSTEALTSAVKALEANGDRRLISRALGEKDGKPLGHKIRSFYNNILDPNSPNRDVTIDTHAVGAALLRPLGSNSLPVAQNFGNNKGSGKSAAISIGTGSKGTYGLYADAMRLAASRVGVSASAMQAITWVTKRNVMTETSEKTDKAIEQTWHDYHEGKISQSEAQTKIWSMATKDVAEKKVAQAASREALKTKSKQGKLL